MSVSNVWNHSEKVARHESSIQLAIETVGEGSASAQLKIARTAAAIAVLKAVTTASTELALAGTIWLAVKVDTIPRPCAVAIWATNVSTTLGAVAAEL